MELTSRVSGEKEAQICKVGVCACIIGPERNTARSSRTNGQWSEHYESIKKKKKTEKNSQYTYACLRGTGHFEVRKRMLRWRKLSVLFLLRDE